MLRLGVNIDHAATLRQARYPNPGFGEPDPIAFALRCEAAGAHGITAHLREDRRHIQDRDILALKESLKTRLNFEMANTEEMVTIAEKLRPSAVCLVPEKREELTTEGGLDVAGNLESVKTTCERLSASRIEVSLFIDAELSQVEAAANARAPVIELHTGPYADAFRESTSQADRELERLRLACVLASERGIQVNLGHGLNYENVTNVIQLPGVVELNIGHSILSRALFDGVETAVKEMLRLMGVSRVDS